MLFILYFNLLALNLFEDDPFICCPWSLPTYYKKYIFLEIKGFQHFPHTHKTVRTDNKEKLKFKKKL